jgi:hypothetical protein
MSSLNMHESIWNMLKERNIRAVVEFFKFVFLCVYLLTFNLLNDAVNNLNYIANNGTEQ